MTDHQIYYDVGCRSIYEMIENLLLEQYLWLPIASHLSIPLPMPPICLPPLNIAACASPPPPTSSYLCLCQPIASHLFLPLPVPPHRLPPLPTAACASPSPPSSSYLCLCLPFASLLFLPLPVLPHRLPSLLETICKYRDLVVGGSAPSSTLSHTKRKLKTSSRSPL